MVWYGSIGYGPNLPVEPDRSPDFHPEAKSAAPPVLVTPAEQSPEVGVMGGWLVCVCFLGFFLRGGERFIKGDLS